MELRDRKDLRGRVEIRAPLGFLGQPDCLDFKAHWDSKVREERRV